MPTYLKPDNLEQALALVSDNAQVVAGATDVYPGAMSERAWGNNPQRDWLDISGLAQLRGIELQAGRWRIGALATWSELATAPLPASFGGLQAAALEIGGVQIQNRATLVGNLCNASPAADGVPPLLCLDASIELRSEQGTRELPLYEFILGNRQTALQPDELATAIIIPDDQQGRGYFYKLGARKYLVISVVMASAVIRSNAEGVVTDARLAIGACSAVAQRMPLLEKSLLGTTLENLPAHSQTQEYFATLQPIDDVRASATYRRLAAREAVMRLFLQASQAK